MVEVLVCAKAAPILSGYVVRSSFLLVIGSAGLRSIRSRSERL